MHITQKHQLHEPTVSYLRGIDLMQILITSFPQNKLICLIFRTVHSGLIFINEQPLFFVKKNNILRMNRVFLAILVKAR